MYDNAPDKSRVRVVNRTKYLVLAALAALLTLILFFYNSMTSNISSGISSNRQPPTATRIPYGPGEFQFGDLRLPDKSKTQNPKSKIPVVVVVHGGFWREAYDLEHIGPACAALTAQGVATWSIEYRRIGNEGGGWPGTFLDVAAALDYLRELAPKYNLDLERVVVIGHSAGGHLALWLAGRARIPEGDPLYTPSPLPVKGAVSLAGVADLRRGWELKLSSNVVEEFLGGAPDDVPGRYATGSPRELLPLGVPQVLIHGTDDGNVPYEISSAYHQAAIAAGDNARLVTLEGAGLFEVIDPQSAEWKKVVEAVLQVTNQ